MTLEPFRANEKINARRKRRLAEEVHKVLTASGGLKYYASTGASEAKGIEPLAALVCSVVQALFARTRPVLHERDVILEGLQSRAENGYGDSGFGNNLPLPERFAYLST